MLEEKKLICFQASALVEVHAPPEGCLEDAGMHLLSSCLFYPRWLGLLNLFCFSCPGEGMRSRKTK